MNKLFKRVASGVIAVCLCTTAFATVASAYNLTEAWNCKYIPGAPSSAQVTSTQTIMYSTYGAIVYCNGASSTVNGASGKTYIDSLNGTMATESITNMGSVVCTPSFSGVVDGAKYHMRASSTVTGNVYTSNGNVVTKTTAN